MSQPRYTLHLGDCLDVLRTLEAGSVDAVVTDPPYGQTNEAYDSDIAFRPEVWAECYRVAKPNAALLSFAGSPTYHRIATAIEAGGWKVRQMWGWVYRDGMIASAYPKEGFDRLAPSMDPIVYATKGKLLLALEREGDTEWTRSPRGGRAFSERSSNASAALAGRGRWPKSIVSDGCDPFEYFAFPRAQASERTGHPNEKPLPVMRWLLSKLPGGVILDPFTGSGSTGKAAILEGFGFVGIEREPDYHVLSDRRLADAANSMPLFPGTEA